jgi:hypothetical protein
MSGGTGMPGYPRTMSTEGGKPTVFPALLFLFALRDLPRSRHPRSVAFRAEAWMKTLGLVAVALKETWGPR